MSNSKCLGHIERRNHWSLIPLIYEVREYATIFFSGKAESVYTFFRFSPLIPLIPSLLTAWDGFLPFSYAPATSVSQPAFANPAAAAVDPQERTSLSWADWSRSDGSRLRQWGVQTQGRGMGTGFRYWEGGGPYLARFDLALAGTGMKMVSPGLRPAYVWDGQGPDHALLDAGLDIRPLPYFLLGWWTENLASAGPEPRIHHLAASVRPFAVSRGQWSDFDLGAGITGSGRKQTGREVFAQVPVFGGLRLDTRWDFRNRQGYLGVTLQASGTWAAALGGAKGGEAAPGMRNRLGAGLSDGRARAAAIEFRLAQKTPHLFPAGRVAELDLNREIAEGESGDGWLRDGSLGFVDLGRRFEALQARPGLKALVIKLGRARCGWAMGEEIRGRIFRLRAKGVHVVAYLEQVSTLNYYLATAADVIALQPQGHFAVNGLSAEVLFYRGLFDKLGVEPQFLRHGKFKSFEEPYTRTGMSDAMRVDLDAFLKSLWENFLAETSRARGIPKDSLRAALESGEISLEHARSRKLIDTLIYGDQLAELAGGKGAVLDRDWPGIEARTAWEVRPKVAVVVVTGDMVLGESARSWLAGPDLAGSSTVASKLRRARMDPSVKAVVLRVDSPGGSAQAADIMWREVELLKKAGKPVVASVGRDAASGGYYLICGADRILAAPNSVVGSIGVLWGKFVLKGLYDKLGLNAEAVKTSPHADANSMARAWDSSEVEVLQRHMDQFYKDFIGKVAAGRKLTTERVDSLGQGRIFTGSQAAANGLVDRLGGLEDAIGEARKLAGIAPGRDIEVAVLSAQGETGLIPVANGDWALAPGMGTLVKRELGRLESMARVDLWAISPELAGWTRAGGLAPE